MDDSVLYIEKLRIYRKRYTLLPEPWMIHAAQSQLCNNVRTFLFLAFQVRFSSYNTSPG